MKQQEKNEEEESVNGERREGWPLLVSDWSLFSVPCRHGKEQLVVMALLNKTAFYQECQDPFYQVLVGSVFHLKHKYPGFVFVEAAR